METNERAQDLLDYYFGENPIDAIAAELGYSDAAACQEAVNEALGLLTTEEIRAHALDLFISMAPAPDGERFQRIAALFHFTGPGVARMLVGLERSRLALDYRLRGTDYTTIAAALGYGRVKDGHFIPNRSGAFKAVQRALVHTLQEPADQLRQLEMARFDQLLAAVWPRATAGDTTAIGTALSIIERKARMVGLDAPQKQQVSGDLTFRVEYADDVTPLPDGEANGNNGDSLPD